MTLTAEKAGQWRNRGYNSHEEACTALWCAVLERAVRDIEALKHIGHLTHDEMTSHYRKRRERDEAVLGYFDTDDFVVVCQLAGVSPDAVRGRMATRTTT